MKGKTIFYAILTTLLLVGATSATYFSLSDRATNRAEAISYKQQLETDLAKNIKTATNTIKYLSDEVCEVNIIDENIEEFCHVNIEYNITNEVIKDVFYFPAGLTEAEIDNSVTEYVKGLTKENIQSEQVTYKGLELKDKTLNIK